MKIKDFSTKVAAYNETIELVAKQIATHAPLFETAGMKQNLLALQHEMACYGPLAVRWVLHLVCNSPHHCHRFIICLNGIGAFNVCKHEQLIARIDIDVTGSCQWQAIHMASP